MKDSMEADQNFSKYLDPLNGQKIDRKISIRGKTTETEIRASKVGDMINRSSNFIKLQQMRSTLIKKSSNVTDFDYKRLRSYENESVLRQVNFQMKPND